MIENKKSIWLIELILRVLAVVSIGFISMNLWSIYSSYAHIGSLMPKYLSAYTAFPHYFFTAFYIAILFFIWRMLKNKMLQLWYVPVIVVILFEFFLKFYFYALLMWFNPFG